MTRVRVPAGTRWNLDDICTSGEVYLVEIGEFGDFDVNGIVDAFDIDLMSEAIRNGVDFSHDLNGDSRLDNQDRVIWVENAAGTTLGDANLDQRVDFPISWRCPTLLEGPAVGLKETSTVTEKLGLQTSYYCPIVMGSRLRLRAYRNLVP